jgi:hypothetical protein
MMQPDSIIRILQVIAGLDRYTFEKILIELQGMDFPEDVKRSIDFMYTMAKNRRNAEPEEFGKDPLRDRSGDKG